MEPVRAMTLGMVLAWGRVMRPAPRMLPDFWPQRSMVDGEDIRVDGFSLLEAARLGTPCTRTGAAASRREPFASVVVTRVVEVGEDIRVDADLAGCRPLENARLIGRSSTEPHAVLSVTSVRDRSTRLRVSLPTDIRVGDLLAVPCRGATAHYDIAR